MLIRIDDFPTGVRPILDDLGPMVEMLTRLSSLPCRICLGVVPDLLRFIPEEVISAVRNLPVEIVQHGYDHCYHQYSPMLRETPGKAISDFDEFANLPLPEVEGRLLKGKLILESIFERQVKAYIPPCNVGSEVLGKALESLGFTEYLSEYAIPGCSLKWRKSDFYGRMRAINYDRKPSIIGLHITWELDAVNTFEANFRRLDDYVRRSTGRDGFALIVPWYVDGDQKRMLEIDRALQSNILHPLIKRIFVLCEPQNVTAFESRKHDKVTVTVIVTDARKTFNDAIAVANAQCAGQTTIIANCDVFFDGSLAALAGRDLINNVLCLSRHEDVDGKLTLKATDCSQDAWIFRAPLKVDMPFGFGVPGCDNRFAFLLDQAGYKVSNPCKRIIVHHLHDSQVRHYTPDVNAIPRPRREVPQSSKLPWEPMVPEVAAAQPPQVLQVPSLTLPQQVALALIPAFLSGRDVEQMKKSPEQWGAGLKEIADAVARGLGYGV